jgi:hypothetical protein
MARIRPRHRRGTAPSPPPCLARSLLQPTDTQAGGAGGAGGAMRGRAVGCKWPADLARPGSRLGRTRARSGPRKSPSFHPSVPARRPPPREHAAGRLDLEQEDEPAAGKQRKAADPALRCLPSPDSPSPTARAPVHTLGAPRGPEEEKPWRKSYKALTTKHLFPAPCLLVHALQPEGKGAGASRSGLGQSSAARPRSGRWRFSRQFHTLGHPIMMTRTRGST